MRVNNFSLLIREGREVDSGHVHIPHGKQFTLTLGNHDNRRCQAVVTMDGKEIGSFQLTAGQRWSIEHPVNDPGKFTAYKAGTEEAVKAGEANISVDMRGLIEVKFTPEKRVDYLNTLRALTPELQPNYIGGSPPNTPWKRGPVPSYPYHPGVPGPGITCSTDSNRLLASNSTAVAPAITGLSGHSTQRYTDVPALDLDTDSLVTITLRIVATDDGPRELKAQPARANAVPAPV